jgi:hypothetical protein
MAESKFSDAAMEVEYVLIEKFKKQMEEYF